MDADRPVAWRGRPCPLATPRLSPIAAVDLGLGVAARLGWQLVVVLVVAPITLAALAVVAGLALTLALRLSGRTSPTPG